MRRCIYIAGPMTGRPNFNFDAFDKAEWEWNDLGFHAHNPARHFGGAQDLEYDLYIGAAVADLVTCQAIVLLPGWYDSYGANVELAVAKGLGLDIYESEGGLYRPGYPLPNGHRLAKGRDC